MLGVIPRGFESRPLRQLEFVKEFDTSRLIVARRSAADLYSFLSEKRKNSEENIKKGSEDNSF